MVIWRSAATRCSVPAPPATINHASPTCLAVNPVRSGLTTDGAFGSSMYPGVPGTRCPPGSAAGAVPGCLASNRTAASSDLGRPVSRFRGESGPGEYSALMHGRNIAAEDPGIRDDPREDRSADRSQVELSRDCNRAHPGDGCVRCAPRSRRLHRRDCVGSRDRPPRRVESGELIDRGSAAAGDDCRPRTRTGGVDRFA